MAQKLPLPLDDPFTDDYESSLPSHPNPLGSHPPPPSRYYQTALRASEDDAVVLSPRSTQTTWSDIELQQRGETMQEEHDKVAILLQETLVPRWYRKPRNIMLLAILALLVVGIAIGVAAAVVYVRKNAHRPTIVPVVTLAVTSTSTRTKSTEASTTTSTLNPPAANAVTVTTAVTTVTVSTVSLVGAGIVRKTITYVSTSTLTRDPAEFRAIASIANTIPEGDTTHIYVAVPSPPTSVSTLPTTDVEVPTTLETIWRPTPPAESTDTGPTLYTRGALWTIKQLGPELGSRNTTSLTESTSSQVSEPTALTALTSSQVDMSTAVTNSQLEVSTTLTSSQVGISTTETSSHVTVSTTPTSSQVDISTTLPFTQVDSSTILSSSQADQSSAFTSSQVDIQTTLTTMRTPNASFALSLFTSSGSR